MASQPEGTLRLTRDQVRAVDRIAVEDFGMQGLVLMENAGRNAAYSCLQAYSESHPFLIICGTGNNGGDGCVIARHVANAGREVKVLAIGSEDRRSPDLRSNLNIIRKMKLPLLEAISPGDVYENATPNTVIVDSVLGTGFQGEVRDEIAAILQTMMSSDRAAMVSIDIPSGLDADTGAPCQATIKADLTLTFVAEKRGFGEPGAAGFVGKTRVLDIGVPTEAIERARAISAP
ncbi:MAG: NAD(P)H-hydrate epimerase [Phycisphaerae bacterium]